MAMSRIIVVFKDPQFMPLSFDTDDYYWNFSGNGTERIFSIHKQIGNVTVLVVPWENLNHFYVSEEE